MQRSVPSQGMACPDPDRRPDRGYVRSHSAAPERQANTLEVGPGGYATIGAAVQAASKGEAIVVHTGTYGEQIDLSAKSATSPNPHTATDRRQRS